MQGKSKTDKRYTSGKRYRPKTQTSIEMLDFNGMYCGRVYLSRRQIWKDVGRGRVARGNVVLMVQGEDGDLFEEIKDERLGNQAQTEEVDRYSGTGSQHDDSATVGKCKSVVRSDDILREERLWKDHDRSMLGFRDERRIGGNRRSRKQLGR